MSQLDSRELSSHHKLSNNTNYIGQSHKRYFRFRIAKSGQPLPNSYSLVSHIGSWNSLWSLSKRIRTGCPSLKFIIVAESHPFVFFVVANSPISAAISV